MKKSLCRILIPLALMVALLPFGHSFFPLSHASSNEDNVHLAKSAPDKGIVDSLFGSKDTQPPSIQIKDNKNDTVYTDKVYIAGQGLDENKITSIVINRIPLQFRPDPSVFFSHLAELREGKNTIAIEATDEAGNRAIKELIVIRKVVRLDQLPLEILSKRMRIAVFPFEGKGMVSEVGSLFQDTLSFAILNQNRFQIVERGDLDMILREQNLSSTKLIDQDTAVNLGRLMAAQAVICGSIIETHTGAEIAGRMIDTETAEILATEKVFCNTRDLTALNFMSEAMAVKFHNDFPAHPGMVIKCKGRYIFTDLGEDKIALHRRLIIYREKSSGEKDAILGYARVTQVLPDMSKAELVSGDIEGIKALDKVIQQ